jgi:arabinose-5-phosphate isomerase
MITKAKEVFNIEIRALEQIKNHLDSDFQKAVDLIAKSSGRVIVMGIGKSGIIGLKIAASLSSTGTPAFFIHPTEAYHGDLGMIKSEDIALLISNSGETEELLKVIAFLKDNKNTIIAMSAKKSSTLGKNSDCFLNINVPEEACPLELAPTSSTTATLVMGDALMVCLMEKKNFKKEEFARYHPGGSLGRKLLLKVKDLMKSENLPIVTPQATFPFVIDAIAKGRLGIAIVYEANNLSGVITDGDIRRAIGEKKGKVLEMTASNFASKNPITIDESESIINAEKIMLDKKITALVVTANKKFKGIIHLYDL